MAVATSSKEQEKERAMNIASLCQRNVRQVSGETTLRAAATQMKQENVGMLAVVDERGRLEGVVTDRDLVVRGLSEGCDPSRTRLAEVMTRHPRTLSAEASVEDALTAMQTLGIRRMPVVGLEGQLLGVLSVDDVVGQVASELNGLARILSRSSPGSAAPAVRPAPRARDLAGLQRAATDPEC
jgi:CBS domain-containing protein